MWSYVLKRLLLIPPMLFGITLISFCMMMLAPGARGVAAGKGGGATEAQKTKLTRQQLEAMEETFHIGQPLYLRYLYWAGLVQPPLSEGKRREWLNKRLAEYRSTGRAPAQYTPGDMEQYRALKELWDRTSDQEQKLPETFSAERVETAMRASGERPPRRGLIWLDFGQSVNDPSISVGQKLAEAIPVTLLISLIDIFIVYLVSIPLGIFSATRQNTRTDRVVTVVLFILYSLPSFWVAVLLIKMALMLPPGWQPPIQGLFPSGAEDMPTLTLLWECTQRLFLPILATCYGGLAGLSRYMRVGMMDVLRMDYIRTARAKGCSEKRVIFKHALRNSVIPIVTMMAGLLPGLIGGSFIIETIFNIPGMGWLGYNAILQRDYTVLMAEFTLSAVLVMFGILLSDILYVLVDPRISFEKGGADGR